MQKFARLWELALAYLAGVVIALANLARYAFPAWRVRPLCYTALPGRIIRASGFPIDKQCFGIATPGDSKLVEKLYNGRVIYSKVGSYLCDWAMQVYILMIQPTRIFIGRILSVVSINVNIPSVLAPIPDNRITASAFAKRGTLSGGRDILDWSTFRHVITSANV